MIRRPRWRCADPSCWAHRWQTVQAWGEYDPMDVALGELERHWAKEHAAKNQGKKAA